MGGKKARDKRKTQRKAEEATAQAAVDAATPAVTPAAAGAAAAGAGAAAAAKPGAVTTKYVSLSGAKGAAGAAADDDDDMPKLSGHALAALNEFYAEKKETEAALKKAAQEAAKDPKAEGKLAIEKFTEDYGLSQFWYSQETIDHLVTAGLAAAGPTGSIACVCTPSLYAAFKQRCGPQNQVYVLEYDQRFKAYSGFVFYDYNTPLSVKLPRGSIDVCVVDPPFLAPECLTKVAQTVAYLTRQNPKAVSSGAANTGFGKVILCTGAVMEETARAAMGAVARTTFVPGHRAERLQNQFRCYVNFESPHLPFAAAAAAAPSAAPSAAAAGAGGAAAAGASSSSSDGAQAKALAAALATLSTAPVPVSKGRRLIIFGAPGSGKGTQCDLIKAKYGCVHVSTGDLLRAEVKAGSALGVEAKGYMARGELVPDPIVFGLLCERLRQPDCVANGWLLDGFPRTAHEIDLLKRAHIAPERFILVNTPDAVLLTRITGRRVDPDTGKTYHLSALPADEAVRKRLVQRKDDTADALSRRLADYHKHHDAVCGAYKAITVAVNGDQTPDKVLAAVCAAL